MFSSSACIIEDMGGRGETYFHLKQKKFVGVAYTKANPHSVMHIVYVGWP